MRKAHIDDVKYALPAYNIISKLADYKLFGKKNKLRLNQHHVPDLEW